MAVSLAGLAARRPQAEAEQEGQSEAEQQQQPGQHLRLCLGSMLLLLFARRGWNGMAVSCAVVENLP